LIFSLHCLRIRHACNIPAAYSASQELAALRQLKHPPHNLVGSIRTGLYPRLGGQLSGCSRPAQGEARPGQSGNRLAPGADPNLQCSHAGYSPHRRPHYPPTERLAILELKTARGWSLARTAKAFLITAATVASWMKRLDEEGPDALVQLPAPVNRFPDFVRYTVQRLKTLCPTMGRVKMAQTLARAGLHLGSTTVRRMLQEEPCPQPTRQDTETHRSGRVVTAKRPNHVWHVDLTTVPIGGFWTSWLPFSLPQRWPFCWWVAVAVDHYSRRVMGCAAFDRQPTSEVLRHFLGRTIAKAKQTPKYLVCDRGVQFDCRGFREWCKRKGVKPPRYGAVGKHGSIAVVERCILTVKTLLACLPLVPYRREAFKRELDAIVQWYNEHRPHEYLGGRRLTKSTSGDSPPIVVLAMNRVLAGHVVRLARGLGHWCVVGPARG
jgi:transposase InsO family protein